MTILVNNNVIETFTFSGGECHVAINPEMISATTSITAHLHNSQTIMQLLLTVDAIKNSNPQTIIDLTIPYFPYARQDRICNVGEAFSLKVMAQLINDLHCNSVTVIDPHSSVTSDLLRNCKVISMTEIIAKSDLAKTIQQQGWLLVAPDKGASEKVANCAQAIGAVNICAEKERNPQTRNITNTTIVPADSEKLAGKDCIVLDDICDGGRTFIELAKVLKQNGAQNLYLYVTHGIFSRGLEQLSKYYQHIYFYQTVNVKWNLPENITYIKPQK